MNASEHPPVVHYRHLQVGWVTLALVLLSLVIFLGVIMSVGTNGLEVLLHPIGLASVALLAVVAGVFGALRTEITDHEFIVAFWPGRPRRVTPLHQIRSVRMVRNHWAYGWGIRLTPHGWLWNVSGLDAVEVVLEGGKRFRAGTDDPWGLAEALAWAADVPIEE